MKALLVFPPHWNPFQPYLSIPCLTGYLRTRGISVEQRDLNIEVFNALLSAEVLRRLLPRVRRRFARVAKSGALGFLERKAYLSLAWAVKTDPEGVVDRIEGAKTFLRSKAAYRDFAAYEDAVATMKQAFRLISAAFAPTEIDWGTCNIGASSLSAPEIVAATCDASRNPFVDLLRSRVIPSILREEFPLVGISVTSVSQMIPAFTIARLLREGSKDIHITLGGNALSRFADDFRGDQGIFSWINSIVLYEGEEALLQLCEAVDRGGNLSRVPNLVYPIKRHGLRRTRICPSLPADKLPSPDFGGLTLESYLVPDPVVPLYGTRGCYWGRCVFCDIHHGNPFRARSVDAVVAEAKSAQRLYNARYFHFVDECLPPAFLDSFAREISRSGMTLRWGAQMRLEPALSGRVAQRLHDAGCRLLFFGIESGSGRLLSEMNKGTSLRSIPRILKSTSAAGILNRVSILVGFPTETDADFVATIRLLSRCRRFVSLVDVSEFMLKRHAPLMKSPERFGIELRPAGRSEFCYHFHFDEYSAERGMPAERIQQLCQYAKALTNEMFPLNRLQETAAIEHILIFLSTWPGLGEFRGLYKRTTEADPSFEEALRASGRTKMVVGLRSGVHLADVEYDLSDLARSMPLEPARAEQPRPCFVLNAHTGIAIRVSPLGKDILESVNRIGVVAQVVCDVRRRWPNVNSDSIMEFLADAAAARVITLREEEL